MVKRAASGVPQFLTSFVLGALSPSAAPRGVFKDIGSSPRTALKSWTLHGVTTVF